MMIYLKAKPEELKETMRYYENPRRYLLQVSSYKLLNDMNISGISEVSFNCQCPKAFNF